MLRTLLYITITPHLSAEIYTPTAISVPISGDMDLRQSSLEILHSVVSRSDLGVDK
jgi:hypothetical protein